MLLEVCDNETKEAVMARIGDCQMVPIELAAELLTVTEDDIRQSGMEVFYFEESDSLKIRLTTLEKYINISSTKLNITNA
jgi:hypothetical protein